MKNIEFDFNRVFLLIKLRLREDYSAVLIAFSGLVLINVFFLFISARQMVPINRVAIQLIGGGGLLLASRSFMQLHSGRSALDYVLLPASNLEKYSAVLISYLGIYPVAASVLAIAGSAIIAGAARMTTNYTLPIWLPFSLDILRAWGGYCLAALLVIWGSVQFKKLPLLKTAFSVGAAYVIPLTLVTAIFFALTKQGLGHQFYFSRGYGAAFRWSGLDISPAWQNVLEYGGQFYTYVLLPGLALVFGYLGLCKKELKDEVQ